MHLETLKTFCDLVETGSLSRAARLNLVSQSAVSQQLRALERRYGRRLIERAPRIGARATEAGRLLYDELKPLLERLAALEQRLRARGGVVAGTRARGHRLQRGAPHPAAGHQALPGRASRGQGPAAIPADERGVRGVPRRGGGFRDRGAAHAAAAAGDRAARPRRAGGGRARRPRDRPPRALFAGRARRAAVHRLRPRHPDPPAGRSPAAPPRRAGAAT